MDGTPMAARKARGGDSLARDRGMIVWLAVGLAVVVVAAKVILLPFEVFSIGQLLRWGLRLSLIVAADLAFVLALASCCWLLAARLARWPRAAKAWRLVTVLAFEIAGVYAVVNVKVLEVTTEML